MAFADLKNDFVFRRIFATHPDILSRAKIALADSDRARIQACSDVGTLDRWIENIIGTSSVGDVLT